MNGSDSNYEHIPSGVYKDKKELAKDHKSSAIISISMGTIGFVFILLSWFGLLPFYFGGQGNVLTHLVMGIFFVALILLGISSALSIKKLHTMGTKEDDVRAQFKVFIEERFQAELLQNIRCANEEEGYFQRMSYMREIVKQECNIPNLKADLVEHMLDEYYDEVFS